MSVLPRRERLERQLDEAFLRARQLLLVAPAGFVVISLERGLRRRSFRAAW